MEPHEGKLVKLYMATVISLLVFTIILSAVAEIQQHEFIPMAASTDKSTD
jgi:hypothetical protein